MNTKTTKPYRHGAVAVLLACALAAGVSDLTTAADEDPAGPSTATKTTKTFKGPASGAVSGPMSGPLKATTTATHRQAPPQALPRLKLPAPTGPHAVGRTSLHLVDHGRRDPWVPEAGARELLVTLYYPARKGTGTPAPYMTTEGARLFLENRGIEDVPAKVLAGTRTHTRTGAAPARGTYPLVVLSPGFQVPGTTLTGLAEDLTSRGYVVAVTDHAYEALGVAFPGKGILPCTACDKVDENTFEPAALGRGHDLSYVLDALIGKRGGKRDGKPGGTRPLWRHAGMIDKSRVGMAGHSMGGAGTAAAMAKDARIRAGANLDGPFTGLGSGADLSGRPFLMMGAPDLHGPGGSDTTWGPAWDRLTGWKRWATLTGADHFAFTDLAPLAGQLGEDDPEGLPGRRASEITRAYTGAFFDQHLRGRPSPLLNGPSADHPEVVFQRDPRDGR
ncbi:alpha/beta hydrolase family protein [Streptomyces lasiicapitis]|uniref:alpha/beta hydrolase family protein n=1 Tax=Streptomyces lasiicapitis TaxID=1923961 RepID=UPI0036C09B2C